MIEGIEPLYQQLADSIQDALPEEWATARMDAIFFADSSTYFGEYLSTDGVAKDFGVNLSGARAFRELRKKFKDAGQPLWGQASFELQSGGRFNLTLGYDNCDENGDTRFDEDQEVRRCEERRRRLTSQ